MVWAAYKVLSSIVACLHIVYGATKTIYLGYSMIKWKNIHSQGLEIPSGDYIKPNIYSVIELSCYVLCFILSILLLIGIIQNRPELISAWIYTYYLVFAGIIGWFLYLVELSVNDGDYGFLLYVTGLYLGSSAILLLLFFPVYKFYKQLLSPIPSSGNFLDFSWMTK